MDYPTLALGLITLQLAAFGWRIVREVSMEDKGERTWLPFSDWVNVIWLLVVVFSCVIRPIHTGGFGRWSLTALSAGFALVGFHPISQAAHYRLFSKDGRKKYDRRSGERRGYPWITDQEIAAAIVSIAVATLTSYIVWHRN